MSPQPSRREYPNPPIEEALCQVFFAEPLTWNVATPGLLFEALRDQYPSDPEAQEQVQAQLQVEPNNPNVAINRGPQRFIYKDESAKRLIVTNATTASVNSLRPYEGWPTLRSRLHKALHTIGQVTPLKPITQVHLRYINRIDLPPGPLDTDDYFNVTVRTADSGKYPFHAFMQRVESILPDNVLAISTFATLQSEPPSNLFLLDLEFRRHELNLTDVDEVLKVADELKELENREFESCITDKARELFE